MSAHDRVSTTTRRSRFLRAFVTGLPVAEAASQAGVSERQAFRYLADPDFQAELRTAERQALNDTTRKLGRLAGGAVMILAKVMADPLTPPAVRVRAASEILARHLQLRSAGDIEDRLLDLEEAAARRESERGRGT